jgi:3-methyladenine DNA glycosylase AlkD
MSLSAATVAAYHAEVVEALVEIGDPQFGLAVQDDRGSQLQHLGVSFPDLRRRVKQGFSFYTLHDGVVLATWDALWNSSPYGDVLFAALEYYLPRARKRRDDSLWPVVRGWAARVDNWCHCDLLSNLYSHLLAGSHDEVLPQLRAWNQSDKLWLRRISLVSLIHYSGKNAVFLPPDVVLPLVSNCLDDHRHYVETAVGWVLREMSRVYPDEIGAYLESHAAVMSSRAFSRAIERKEPGERTRFREVRATALTRR